MIVSAKVIGAGVSFVAYSRQDPGVSRGDPAFVMSRGELMNFASNPRRWMDGYRAKEADTDATRWGSLIEALAGLNGDFEARYAVAPETYPDKKTGEAKDWNWNATFCKDWREEQGEREVIKSELREKAELAVSALEADAEVSDLFAASQKQVMVVGTAKVGAVEIPLRCLLDLVPAAVHPTWGHCLADFKTGRCGDPGIMHKVIEDGGYDAQAALSLDLYVTATGEDRTDWLLPFQENVPPYHVTKPMPALSVEFLRWGRAKYHCALAEYARCLSTGVWPSFATGERLVLNSPPCQIIGPEKSWTFRETGGLDA